MLNYSECKKIQNIDKPSGRVYDTPLGLFPSVTTVLGKTADKAWLDAWIERVGEQEANNIKNAAAERGKILHDYLEKLYEQYPCPTLEQIRTYISTSGLLNERKFIQDMFKNICKYLLANNFESVSQEFVVWDSELKIAGRCDGLGYWNNKLVVVDYKSSKRKKYRSNIKDYLLQATAYCRAHNQMFDKKVEVFVILVGVEDGTSQLFTGLYKNYEMELITRVNTYYNTIKA